MLLTLRCEESTRLMSEAFQRDLTGAERWAVRLHFISCRYCRRVKKQWDLLQETASRRTEVVSELSEEARGRILASLRKDES